jgi:hypothetical protein
LRFLPMAGHRGETATPRYFFRISQGGQPQTSSASDCPDEDAAKKEASGMFADMARDIADQLQSIPDWQIEVSNDTGKSIFRIKLTAESPE